MNFDDTPQEAAFRSEARGWIEANAPKELEDELSKPRSAASGSKNDDIVDVAKAWQKKKAEAGWACLHWPKEYGGRGAIADRARDLAAGGGRLRQAGAAVPDRPGHVRSDGDGLSPAKQQKRIICRSWPPASTSGASCFPSRRRGSDVAGLRTRAEKDGDDWIVNGQKIWTSGAHYSDYGLLITRTDPNVPKHKGLTMFFLDMKSPGVEVRPIKQANGMPEFNEVYFTDVAHSRSAAARRRR